MTAVPCKDCAERHDRCHSKCERYSNFKMELDKIHKVQQADCEYAFIHSRQALNAMWRKYKKEKRR